MKIKSLVFLGLVSVPFLASAENCIKESNGSLVKVLECVQRGLDSQQKWIIELEKENKALQKQVNTQKERLTLMPISRS